MKTIFTIFIYFFSWNVIIGQDVPPAPIYQEEACISICEEMPRFPGCEDLPTTQEKQNCANQKMLQFIISNFRYPKEDCIQGMIVVAFTVEKDGSLTDFKVMRDIGAGEEALRVAKMMPNFIPGRQAGRLVRTRLNVPIRICLD